MRWPTIRVAAAIRMADGNVSLEDWPAFTWSFGCTGVPARTVARVARTSLTFMFVEVPEPVWNTSMGNWSSWRPESTSSAAVTMASVATRSR